METSNSAANHAVLQSQNDRWGLGPIETCTSGSKVAVFNAKNHGWGLGPIETCNSGSKVAVLHTKTTNEGCDKWRLVILMLFTLFCMHKTTGEVWDPWRLAANHAVLRSQNDRRGLGPIETCISGPKVAVLHSKATNEGRDPYTLVFLVLKSLFWMH